MVQHLQTNFDASFAALAAATRRGVLEQLARADASITDLADKFDMTLTGMTDVGGKRGEGTLAGEGSRPSIFSGRTTRKGLEGLG